MNTRPCLAFGRVLALLVPCLLVHAGQAVAQGEAISSPPVVKSAALFKNGLGFLSYEVVLPEGATIVRIEGLPVPAHGTFWITYDDDVAIGAMVAGTDEVTIPVPITDLKELLRANAGRRARLWTFLGQTSEILEGKILELEVPEADRPAGPQTMGASLSRAAPAGSPAALSVVVLETDSGVVALRADAVQRVDFEDEAMVDTLPRRQKAAFLRVERPRADAAATITVTGLVKGLTWVPSYAIDISDPETAVLRAKAVVVDEVVDLEAVRLDLVTGYPHAMFGDVRSALAPGQGIGDFLASLARRGSAAGGVTTRQLVMTNAAAFDSGADVYSSEVGAVAEDLFLYPVEGVTLRPGESAYLPLFTAEVPYRHVYTWRVGGSNVVDDRWTNERASASIAEPVWNTFRFTNPLDMPLTTAAAEFLRNGAFVGQDVCHYAAPGQETTVRINRAMNLLADAREVELERERTSVGGTSYDLVKVRGELKLRSRLPRPASVEITQQVVGEVLVTTPEARVVRAGEGLRRVNPSQEMVWELEIQPGQSLTAVYEYQVYVR